VKRFNCFRHAVLHLTPPQCWNVSVFYFSFVSVIQLCDQHYRGLLWINSTQYFTSTATWRR